MTSKVRPIPSPNGKYDHVYAIIRVDTTAIPGVPLSQLVVVTKMVWSQETAEREVERLNRLNGSKGATYFWMITRLERKELEVQKEG